MNKIPRQEKLKAWEKLMYAESYIKRHKSVYFRVCSFAKCPSFI